MPNDTRNQLSAAPSANVETIQNPEVIKAQGQARSNYAQIIVIGVILGILALGGITDWLLKPESAKDMWVVIGPIISAGIGFLAGKKTDAHS